MTKTKTAAVKTNGDQLEALPRPSRDQLEARRQEPPIVRGPSGATYVIRKVNLERHALSGGLPVKLRRAAMEGVKGLERILSTEEQDDGGSNETRDYLDDDPLLPPQDYAWAVKVAMGEEEYDADGRRLWGTEPLDRFATFRAFHGCDEDCEGCAGFRAAVSHYVESGRIAA